MYAQYVDHPRPDQEMLDTFIMATMKCGLFNTSYENWHARPDKNKTWTEATVFWDEEINLKRTCAVTAGQYVFGGNATDTATTESDTAYEQSVHDFSLDFDKSQTTISLPTHNFNNNCNRHKWCARLWPIAYRHQHIKYGFNHNNRFRASTNAAKIAMEADRKIDVVTTERR